MCEKEIRHFLRATLAGGVWNCFLLGRMRGEHVPCRFCGGDDGDGHLLCDCTFPPLVELMESPEFCPLIQVSKESWPRFLLWHGWLPALSGNSASPWAGRAHEVARNRLDCAFWVPVVSFLLRVGCQMSIIKKLT